MYMKSLAAAAIVAPLALTVIATSGQAAGGKPEPRPAAAVVAKAKPADAAAAAKSVTALSSATSLAARNVSTRIVALHKSDSRYTYATYADATTGKVVIETDAPASVTKSLAGNDASKVTIRKTAATVDQFSRRDDVPAFWGGGGITFYGSSPQPQCSSGYTVKNSAGTKYMITAGHCFSNGQSVGTELNNRFYGYVSGNGLPSQDMELIYAGTYSPYIFNGGVNSTSGWHIAGAGDSAIGYANYCHSGRTTGENCGHTVISNTATVCTSSGCKSPVTAFQGGYLPQGGDSGSPFYVGASSGNEKFIRGHVIAGNGTTEYVEKWSRVAARWGVTIATS